MQHTVSTTAIVGQLRKTTERENLIEDFRGMSFDELMETSFQFRYPVIGQKPQRIVYSETSSAVFQQTVRSGTYIDGVGVCCKIKKFENVYV